MKKVCLIISIIGLCLSGCSEIVIPLEDPKLVVEGWIEDGGHPIVMITTSLSVSQEYQEWTVLYENMLRWAKVTVSDGQDTVVLTGRRSKDYFPPYVYTTAKMVGEAGKTYHLNVEYDDMVATAVTTIPHKVNLEYVKVVESDSESTKYNIIAGLRDNPDTRDYYRFFAKNIKIDSVYIPSFMGLIDDTVLSEGINDVFVYGGFVANLGSERRSSINYTEEEVISFRLSTMDEASFNYWEDYDDISSLSKNPFFPVYKKIRSNISSGMGYWAGYGSSYYYVSIADSIALGRVFPFK